MSFGKRGEVQIVGLVPESNESWMLQITRNLVNPGEGFLRSSRLLIHDCSTLFSAQFRQLLRSRRGADGSSPRPMRPPTLDSS